MSYTLPTTIRRRFAAKACQNVMRRARRDSIPHDAPRALEAHLFDVWPDRHRCPDCGEELGWQAGDDGDVRRIPHVDKILPARGYVAGNVRVVCAVCNVTASDYTDAETIARAILGLLGKAQALGLGDVMPNVARRARDVA